MALLAALPEPRTVLATDGLQLATYDTGDADGPTVVAVHGFASSAYANFAATGWIRELTRAGYRVVAFDQRGHGRSGKPHDPAAYTMATLVADVQTVLDTYLLDDVGFVGYSLGARVGWHLALESPHRVRRAVFGGIPDGDPLTRFRVDQARAFVADGTAVDDRLTDAYLTMASTIAGNDLPALIALVEGMRGSPQPDRANPPLQPILFATGSADRILPASRALAESAPRGEFFEIADRNHFNAPTARSFRDRAVAFLEETEEAEAEVENRADIAPPEPPALRAPSAPPPASPQPDTRPADAEQVAFARSFREFIDAMRALAPNEQILTPLGERVLRFLGRPVDELPTVTERVDTVRLVDADIALTELSVQGEVFGIAGLSTGDNEPFVALLRHQHASFTPGPVDVALIASGPGTTRRVLSSAVRLFHFEGEPVAVLQRLPARQWGRDQAQLEILCGDTAVAARLVDEVRRRMRERSVLRGQVLTFAGGAFDDASAGAVFLAREAVPEAEVVLAPGVLDRIRRHVLGIGEHRARLADLGAHLKRGVLLYGPPGTGKTLTVRHLVGAATGSTVVLLSGANLRFVSAAVDIARALQPAIVVLEDIDLIAEDRDLGRSDGLLFEVLDALDGIGGDADVAFVMTTNRVDHLERALTQRPGRVDLAVQIERPGAAERARLFALYGRRLPLSEGAVAAAAEQAAGTTASFAKELMRRVAMDAAWQDRDVTDADLSAALAALLADGEQLTRTLLGGAEP
ncbi:alpha/beta fold hydrolase [uncultured Amnibacterium sp.]|uniref:alpha/beta fold hydrolase n=1 Tax=uncultured Amnibacterium sp. TaxID=1631851 RepID=UPI0035CC8EF1